MMNDKINQIINKYDLQDLFDGYFYSNNLDIKKEIRGNYVTISFNQEDANNCSIDDIVKIITMIINAKKRYLEENNLPPMLFYMWYAEQSMCLSYCIISYASDYKLPFGRKVIETDKMQPIIESFLFGCGNDEILLSDCEVIKNDYSYEEMESSPLLVFVKVLKGVQNINH